MLLLFRTKSFNHILWMGGLKKRKSKRLTTRKRKSLLKRAVREGRKKRRLVKKFRTRVEKVPISVMRTDEENFEYIEMKRRAEVRRVKYNEEMKDTKEVPMYFDLLQGLMCQSDILLEVIDARDPYMSRNVSAEDFIKQQGKRVMVVFNYCQYVPMRTVDEWKKRFCDDRVDFVDAVEDNIERLFNGKRVGIFGGSKCGKNFVHKMMKNIRGVDAVLLPISIPPSEVSLSGILRGSHDISKIEFKYYVEMALKQMSMEDVCLHYKIPMFDDVEEFLMAICDEYNITEMDKERGSMRAADVFFTEFFEHKILFWREAASDKNHLCFELAKKYE